MIYLVLAIIFGSLFTVIYKICQIKGVDSLQVTLFNYVVAFVFGIVPIIWKILSDPAVSIAEYSIPAKANVLGVCQGIIFTVTFLTLEFGVRKSGVALSTLASKSSLVLPVILSWLLLGQSAPNWLSVILILAALTFIVLPAPGKEAAVEKTGKEKTVTIFILAIVFLVYGCSDFMLKVSQHSVDGMPGTHLDMLMCLIFLFASISSLIVCIACKSFRKHPVSYKSIIGGLALGIANVSCTASILHGLSSISTSLFFPVYNVGAVVLSTTVGIIAFKEKISWPQRFGIALATAAIILQYI